MHKYEHKLGTFHVQQLSRQTAIKQGQRLYYTGKACKRGHVAPRYVKTFTCQQCQQSQDARNYTENAARRQALSGAYKEKNKTTVAKRSYGWKQANWGKVIANVGKRRSARLTRTPNWADLTAIEAVYEQCAQMNAVHGKRSYHVDHIIPLQGEDVSGLNVHTNLQILTGPENLRKSNKWSADHE